MKIFAYIFLGMFGLLGILFGILQFWLWTIRQKDMKEAKRLVQELTENNTPKLSKKEQFMFLDGSMKLTKMQDIIGEKSISLLMLDYFIEVEPDEYLNHLRMHNPPASWTEDLYGEVEIKKTNNGYEIIYYDRGKETSTKSFYNYDQLLRYLVYERLSNVGLKYNKLINKIYYK